MDKKECFAYNEDWNECTALIDLYCEKEGKCSFFKTKEQIEEENKKFKNK